VDRGARVGINCFVVWLNFGGGGLAVVDEGNLFVV